jgi:hypothetical protein
MHLEIALLKPVKKERNVPFPSKRRLQLALTAISILPSTIFFTPFRMRTAARRRADRCFAASNYKEPLNPQKPQTDL